MTDPRRERIIQRPYKDLSDLTAEQKLARKREQGRQWKRDNPERTKHHARTTHNRIKREVFEAYGGRCECCGETDLHFLTIDHINGVPDRHKHPSGRRISGTAFLLLLRAEGYPNDCRVLCWNCNCARGYYGFCPHLPHSLKERRYQ